MLVDVNVTFSDNTPSIHIVSNQRKDETKPNDSSPINVVNQISLNMNSFDKNEEKTRAQDLDLLAKNFKEIE